MIPAVGFGFLTILVAGVLNGSCMIPWSYMKNWPVENRVLMNAIVAMLLLPWPFVLWTVPNLFRVLGDTSHAVLLRTLAFGFLWGVSAVLYSFGIDMLGLALGTAIMLGLGTSVGTLVPLIGQHREKILAPSGITTLIGVALLTIAVTLLSVAGTERERILQACSGQSFVDRGLVRSGRHLAGLLVCILCGVLNPLFNIAFAYGTEIEKQAIKQGANPAYASNAVWLLVVNVGFLPSFFYGLYLLTKNRTWSAFRVGGGMYWVWQPIMGLMWIACVGMYGTGALRMGPLGPVIGWPAFMSTSVLAGIACGFFTGEWKGIHGRPVHIQTLALVILIAAMFTLGWASKL